MALTMFEDAEEKKLSLMNKRKTVCDGQKDGFQCTHYIKLVQKIDTPNAIVLEKGETSRWCLLIPTHNGPLDLGDGGGDMMVECNQYQASHRKYVAGEEAYNPMSEERVNEIRADGGLPAIELKPSFEDEQFDRTCTPRTPEEIEQLPEATADDGE